MKKRITELTPDEERAWIWAFVYYLENGKTNAQSGKLAWRVICKEFPRLRKYDGCKP